MTGSYMMHKDAKTQWIYKQTKNKTLKRLKKMRVLVTKLYWQAIEPNSTEYFKFLLCSLTKSLCIIHVNFTESTRTVFRLSFFNLIFESI